MIPANTYIHIEYWMTELGLRPIQVWIYAIIHGFCQDGISSYRGSQRYFREWTHAARSTVMEALHEMEARNLIVSRDFELYGKTFKEYYTVASRSAYQELAKAKKENRYSFQSQMTGNQSGTCPKIEHTMSENQSSTCPKTGHNNIANNKFNNAADSTDEEVENADGAAAALISEKIKELFGSTKVFDSDFVYEIERVLFDNGVGEDKIDAYLKTVFEKTVNKHPSSIPGLFRKLAVAQDVIQDFILKMPEEKPVEKTAGTECPVCGKQVKSGELSCECGFDVADFNDSRKIALQKAVNALPEDEKNELEKEVADAYLVVNFMDFMRPEKIKERNEKLVKIYAQRGIKYDL